MFSNIMDELDYDVANFNPTIKESLLASLAFFEVAKFLELISPN